MAEINSASTARLMIYPDAPSPDRFPQQAFLFVNGKDEHPYLGIQPLQAAGRFDPIHPGHADVQQDDVRLQLSGQPESLFAVLAFPHHFDVWLVL
jgi:hypothetical protein